MKKAFDQTVRDLKREVNKKVLKVTIIEQKTLDATSNEPWGPQGSVLAEIAQATYNYHDYQLIMAALWKRIQDTGKNWRHVYKALSLLEYLVVHGSERVIDDTREHAYQISALSEFLYTESNGRDQGSNVRRKSQGLVALVNNKEKLQEARQNALSKRDKNHNSLSAGASLPPLSSSVRYDDEQPGGHGGNRDDGYMREKDGGTYRRGGYKYTQEGDQYRKDIDVQYSRDDSFSVCGNDDYQYRSRCRSVDGYSDRSYDDHLCSTQSIEHKLSADSIDAPPSYEEATGGSCTDVQDDKDSGIVTASLPNTSSPSAPKETSSKGTNQAIIDHNLAGDPVPTHDKQVDCFGDFDPRGSVSAALPASASSLEFDIFGFSVGGSTNIPAPLPMTSTTTSEVHMLPNSGTNFEPASTCPNEPDENPFGDAPFKAIPQEDFPSHVQKSASVTSSQVSSGFVRGADIYLSADTKMEAAQSYDFGGTLGGLSYAPSAVNGQHSRANSEFYASEIPAVHSSDDILDGILPRTGHMVSVSSQEATTQFSEPGFSGYAASHAHQNPLQVGSVDMQIGQINPFEQPELSNHLASQADSFACPAFQPIAESQAIQMISLEQFGFSEPQMQGAPVFPHATQLRNPNMIQVYASEHPGMRSPLAQVAPFSIQASQSASPNKIQAVQMNYKDKQQLSSPQTSQGTSLHVGESAVPASQGTQWNQLQQPGLSASLPSQTTPVSSHAFPPASTNEMQVDKMNSLNQTVLSAPQISQMYSGLFQTVQATVPANLHGAQMNPLQQASLSASPAQAALVSSQAFHSEVSPSLPSAQRNPLQQPLMSAPQSSLGVPVLSQAFQSVAPANMQAFQVNPSSQHVLPGMLTSQAAVSSSQHFQPADPTSIHAPQVYPLLQRLSAPPASQNIPASSQAPSNKQTGWSSFTPQSAVPDLLVSSLPPTRPQPSKDKFEPKSAVWADTLSRGLVNLNISGPKINPLADIGIDFDDINRKEKRIELSNSHAPATMGKAMGTGSGLGRTGPGALAPPINPKMGSNMALGMSRGGMGIGGGVGTNMGMDGGGGFSMGMGMGGGGNFGMGMGGHGGNMNQPSVGVGMGMAMLPPSGMPQQGHGMPGAYYHMNAGGGYGQQQPYGGAGYR